MKYIIVGIIISLVIFVFTLYLPTSQTKKGRLASTPKLSKKCFLSGLGLLVILTGCFVTVPANSVGVVYDELRGGVQIETLGEGLKVISPFQKVTKISTINKNQTISLVGQTKDAIYANFVITVTYRVEKVDAGKFFRVTNNEDIKYEQLSSIVKEALQVTTSKYDIYSILGEELALIQEEFKNTLSKYLNERYSITTVSVSFDDIDAGERIEEIIRQKGEAQQKIEIEKLEKEKATIEAERLIVEANARADVIKIEAKANADKIETEKEAILTMIQNFSKQFTALTEQEVAQIVLQSIFMDKWDGKLPEVLTSESLSALIGSLIQSSSNSQTNNESNG